MNSSFYFNQPLEYPNPRISSNILRTTEFSVGFKLPKVYIILCQTDFNNTMVSPSFLLFLTNKYYNYLI